MKLTESHQTLISNVVWMILSGLVTATAYGQTLAEFESQYIASANGISATAKRLLQKNADDSYLFTSSLVAEFGGTQLAALKESSRFRFVDDQLLPDSYLYSLSGISEDSISIIFDWDAQLAVSSAALKSWPVSLIQNTQDPLSYQLLLPQLLNSGQVNQLQIPVVDGDTIDIEEFSVVGHETIETPVGTLDCVIIEKLREPNNRKSTRIWLAKDHDYHLAKLEQITSRGVKITLELISATIAGKPLAP